MIHNPCQRCGLPKVSTINPFCGSCTHSMDQGIGGIPNTGIVPKSVMDKPMTQPAKLTRDQAIRAKALTLAAEKTSDVIIGTDDFFKLAAKFEDYIRDGRKGDE